MDDARDAPVAAAALSCASCGIRLDAAAKYCSECGTPVTLAPQHAEFKQVTVLFADVVHSMDIAAAVGAERLREIMADLADRCATVVRRYGGTVDKFTGDGIMAIFGAPVALEDHAMRACLAALELQDEADGLAVDVQAQNGVALYLRVGLNSGEVIAGELGSKPFGYTAIGEQVGLAQRMESIAQPGGVMLSAGTARLVDHCADLGETELVEIKGACAPVPARRLLGIRGKHHSVVRSESSLVGRQWEMSVLEGLLDRAVEGRGAVVGLVGSPGIGKSRMARQASANAASRGFDVFSVCCESHTSQIPFHAVARLLRAATGVEGLQPDAARARIRANEVDAETEDLMLLEDLLGIGAADMEPPRIDPDARRRRLTALVNAASLARERPAVYVVEDAHWIDPVSESMLADFLTVIPQTRSLMIVTYRPEYRGALTNITGAQTVALEPLRDREIADMIDELLGPDTSVARLGELIAEKAGGTPLFAEEIVRDLVERGVLQGTTGAYASTGEVGEIWVPATLHATISARIDRLEPKSKRTLAAAAVVGSRFGLDLLTAMGVEPVLDELLATQVIDQVRFTREPEYVFHHPLVRRVAYESQLKSDRAELHRRLAVSIQERSSGAVDERAALIAEHLEAAGELHAGYEWHMRAGSWFSSRDIAAARLSWERARRIADGMPVDDGDRTAMSIAPRTLLCGSGWRGDYADTSGCFEELRELCCAAGDHASLAIGMTGLIGEHYAGGRLPAASRCVDEQMVLLDSISDPALTVGLSGFACIIKHEAGQFADVWRWSNRAIELAGDDPTMGDAFFGSPLAILLALRGFASWALGRTDWSTDLDRAVVISRAVDPISFAATINTKYTPAISCGVLLPDDAALNEIHEALRIAERSADDVALGLSRTALGIALVHRDSTDDRAYGREVLEQLYEMCMREHYYRGLVDFVQIYVARERSRLGENDNAVALVRAATDHMLEVGQLGAFVPATGILVEVLLRRGDDRDVAEAEAAIDRLASASIGEGFVPRDLWLLRLRALMAATRGDDDQYLDFRDRYRAIATLLGFEGHMQWVEAMP
ncbi:adenylate/guanylate cyclase domain-containing protein [Mycobacterium sp. 852014-52144_SCH5372336]|uniref:ATP-binding protein n=1 Tax=Mycobacterium sp. 852014-52144_SCH5372336 TaxID=1834115 RepID=UPI001E360701|nr:adenylate/guanylate cyclase domain-containing protein [Mycobacterium sp. 852014-52144_SCH5372336]